MFFKYFNSIVGRLPNYATLRITELEIRGKKQITARKSKKPIQRNTMTIGGFYTNSMGGWILSTVVPLVYRFAFCDVSYPRSTTV